MKSKSRFGLVYRAINTINGKSYIGKTLSPLRKRKRDHLCKLYKNYYKNNKFYNALRKYGVENFRWEVLVENVPEEDLDWAESQLIITFDTKVSGYNSTNGALEEKNIKTKKGRVAWNKGKTAKTDERVAKIAQKMKGKKRKEKPESRNPNITYETLYDCIINKQMSRTEAAEYIGTTERLVKKWKQVWKIKSPNDGRIKKGQHLSPETEFKAKLE